jgi:hypothetical protein
MGKFLLFTSPTYYPYGGMDDCKGEFASLNAAVDHATESADYSATENILNLLTTVQRKICTYSK